MQPVRSLVLFFAITFAVALAATPLPTSAPTTAQPTGSAQPTSANPWDDWLINLTPSQRHYVELGGSIGLIALGILFVFIGYRVIRVILFLNGVLIAFGVTFLVLVNKTHLSIWLIFLIAGGAGLIGGFIFVALMFVGIFCIGALLGLALAAGVLATPLGTKLLTGNLATFLTCGIAALGGGIIALVFQKILVVLGTAWGGAYMIGTGLDILLIHSGFASVIPELISQHHLPVSGDNLNWKPIIVLGGVLVLAIAGAVVQFCWTVGNYDHRRKKPRDEEFNLLVQ